MRIFLLRSTFFVNRTYMCLCEMHLRVLINVSALRALLKSMSCYVVCIIDQLQAHTAVYAVHHLKRVHSINL